MAWSCTPLPARRSDKGVVAASKVPIWKGGVNRKEAGSGESEGPNLAQSFMGMSCRTGHDCGEHVGQRHADSATNVSHMVALDVYIIRASELCVHTMRPACMP